MRETSSAVSAAVTLLPQQVFGFFLVHFQTKLCIDCPVFCGLIFFIFYFFFSNNNFDPFTVQIDLLVLRYCIIQGQQLVLLVVAVVVCHFV